MLVVVETSRVWVEIDLDALQHNLAVLRRSVGAQTELLLVVKADAYGHGAVAVAHHALRSGVRAFGVGTASEALKLRESGNPGRILVLGTIVDAEADACLRNGVELGLHSRDRARVLERDARRIGAVARVHLNVDTGMGRLGVLPRRAAEVLRVVKKSPELELAGVMTHLSATGPGDPRTAEQLKRFDRVVAAARDEGLIPDGAWIHAANSTGILDGHGDRYDAVRLGIGAFGLIRGEGPVGLRPVLSWRAQIIFLKDVPRGSRIGYGGTWTARRRTRIATLPVGYNDGLAWSLGNKGTVLVRGRRCPIVGLVSMDYATVDVTDVPGARVGDVATMVGRDGDERITVAELAELSDTIPYEVTCRIGPRVGRKFVGGVPSLDAERATAHEPADDSGPAEPAATSR